MPKGEEWECLNHRLVDVEESVIRVMGVGDAHVGKDDQDRFASQVGFPLVPIGHTFLLLAAPHLLTSSIFSLSFFLSFHSPLPPSLLPEFLSFSSRLGHLTPSPFSFL